MTLDELRHELDLIDKPLLDLFLRRLAVAQDIAALKKAEGLPIYHPAREKEILQRIGQDAGDLAPWAEAFYQAIFHISRAYQSEIQENAL